MRGKPFEPGNKFGKGRPPGSKNKKSKFREALEEHGEAIIQKAKVMALNGHFGALRTCIERLIPPARSEAVPFPMPKFKEAKDLKKVLPSALKQVSKGRLSAFEAEAIGRGVEAQLRIITQLDVIPRLEALEQQKAQDEATKNLVWVPEEEEHETIPTGSTNPESGTENGTEESAELDTSGDSDCVEDDAAPNSEQWGAEPEAPGGDPLGPGDPGADEPELVI